jgi:hypothetical protein
MYKQKDAMGKPHKLNQLRKGVFNMTKKRNSFLRMLTSAALAAAMMLSMAVPVLAADDFSAGQNAGNPAKAALTKIFKVPVNTTTPEAAFTFTIEKVGVDNKTDDTTKGNMPDLSAKVSFTLGQTETFIDTATGTKYLVAQTENILAGINTNGSDWKAGGGIYKYTIKEAQTGITPSADTTDTEYTIYSGASYDLEIWVEEDNNGILFARYAVAYYIPGTPDEYFPSKPGEGKIDPTPGTTAPGTPGEIGEKYSNLIFTTKDWKTAGPVDPGTTPKGSALEIEKKVAGNNPDYGTYFDFGVTVVTPAIINNPGKTYNAYIVDENGYVALGAAGNPNTKSGTDAYGRDYITITSGNEKTVQLKHGERLVFFDLEVGAEVRVFETIAANTRVKYTRTFSTGAGTEFNMTAGLTGNWGFPRNPGDVGPHYIKESTGGNNVTFTNTMAGNPPTGITVDNLPYIVLIGLAVAGLVSFVVLRLRKNAKYDS